MADRYKKYILYFRIAAIAILCLYSVTNAPFSAFEFSFPGCGGEALQVVSRIKPITEIEPVDRPSQITDPEKVVASLKDQVDAVEDICDNWPKAVAIFGGTSIPRDSELYDQIVVLGKTLSLMNIPRRTGGGPGAMEAALAFKSEKDIHDRQGVNISAWDDTNQYVELEHRFDDLALRKRALYGNARGVIIAPGGYGAIDELWECVCQDVPFVLFGKKFWEPIIRSFKKSMDLASIKFPEDDFFITDSQKEAVEELMRRSSVVKKDNNLNRFKTYYLKTEIEENLTKLSGLPPSVVLMGRPIRMKRTKNMKEIISRILLRDVPLRMASGGNLLGLANRFLKGEMVEDKRMLQNTLLRRLGNPKRENMINMMTSDQSVYNILLAENSLGYVFSEGGPRAMNVLFGLASGMRAGLIPKRPIVLVGKDFWEGIKETVIDRMENCYEFRMASAEDEGLMTIVDTPEEAMQVLMGEGEEEAFETRLTKKEFGWLFDVKSVLTLLEQKGAMEEVGEATPVLYEALEGHFHINFPYMYSNDEMWIRFRPPSNPKQQFHVRCYDPRIKDPIRNMGYRYKVLQRIPVSGSLSVEMLLEEDIHVRNKYELENSWYDAYYRMVSDITVARNVKISRQNILNAAELVKEPGIAVMSDAGRLTDVPLKRLLAMKLRDASGEEVHKFEKIYIMDMDAEDMTKALQRFDLAEEERERVVVLRMDLSLGFDAKSMEMEKIKSKGGRMPLEEVDDLLRALDLTGNSLPFAEGSVNFFASSAGVTSFYILIAKYLYDHIIEESDMERQEAMDNLKRTLINYARSMGGRFLEEVSRVTNEVAYIAGCVDNEVTDGKILGTEDLRELVPESVGEDMRAIDSWTLRTKDKDGWPLSLQTCIFAKSDSHAYKEFGNKDKPSIITKDTDNTSSPVADPLAILEESNKEFQKTRVSGKGLVLLVPTDVMNESQKKWKTYFNKISDKTFRGEKLRILDVEGMDEEEKTKALAAAVTQFKSEGYQVVTAVNDAQKVDKVMEYGARSLVFEGGVDLYFIMTCLRALYRERTELLVTLYGMLTGEKFEGSIPDASDEEAFAEFLKAIVFRIPDAVRMDYDIELEAYNNEIKQFILSA